MCRRVLAVLVALGCLALAAAPSAQGQAPTIVTDITFPEEGEPFGTFTILFHPQSTPATPPGCLNAGPFAVVGGTGAYAHLRGTGEFCNFPEGERVTETFTGRFRLS